MEKVILGGALRSQLDDFSREVEFCDEKGSTLGYFLPTQLRDKLCSEWAKTRFTDKELDDAERQSGGKTTAELLEWLKTLSAA